MFSTVPKHLSSDMCPQTEVGGETKTKGAKKERRNATRGISHLLAGLLV